MGIHERVKQHIYIMHKEMALGIQKDIMDLLT